MVAASSTQVDVGRNAGGTHAGRTPGIYTHGTLAVLAVSDKKPVKEALYTSAVIFQSLPMTDTGADCVSLNV
jgi:hypothetical protein